jgi:hypothetical protein
MSLPALPHILTALFELAFQEWNLLMVIIDNGIAVTFQPPDIPDQFAVEGEWKCQYQASETGDGNSLAKKLALRIILFRYPDWDGCRSRLSPH